MSNSINIKVDGESTTLSVDRLRTNRNGGGTADWVSTEDQNGVAKLHVYRNGTYTPDSFNVDGFDVVDVSLSNRGGAGAELDGEAHSVEPVIEAIEITEGGKKYDLGNVKKLKTAQSGGGNVEFAVAMSSVMDDLSVTSEGVYTAKNSGLYAYDGVTVNVSGGGGGGQTKPNSIRITTMPTKLAYADGEAIDITGMVVKAYRNGEIWTGDGTYPNGIIPNNELLLPQPTFIAIKRKEEETINYNGVRLWILHAYEAATTWGYNVMWASDQPVGTTSNGYSVKTGVYGREVRYYYLTKYTFRTPGELQETETTYLYMMQADGFGAIENLRGASNISYDLGFLGTGTPWRYKDITGTEYTNYGNVPFSDYSPVNIEFTIDDMIVPVQWKRPIDGVTLETNFIATGSEET